MNSSGTRFNKLVQSWSQDRISSQAAALAYYTVFSLAPILLICISVAGIVYGNEAAQGQILGQIKGVIGNEAALQIQELIAGANKPVTAWWARFFSIIVLLFSASGVFSEIQTGLNLIWGVKADPNKGWMSIIKARFLSFVMVLGVAFLLLVSLIISAILASLSNYISHFMSTSILVDLLISDVISFFIISILFAMMYKILPDVEIKWADVWFGALITSLLFTLGKMLIGFYLNQFHIASVFGAAGSMIIILIWAYYTSQIFFIGAEITKVFSTHRGKKIIPARNAIALHK